jgi:signal transducer and activator of transcription 5A/signal transducer and activator of transcription 5B
LRFLESIDEIGRVQQIVVFVELARWKQNQRHFLWEDDASRNDLNQIQHWFESLAELLWRLRQLGKQVMINILYAQCIHM